MLNIKLLGEAISGGVFYVIFHLLVCLSFLHVFDKLFQPPVAYIP